MDGIVVAIKYVATFWMLLMILVALISLGSASSERYERKSRYLLMATLCVFLPCVRYFTKDPASLFGFYSLGFPWLNYSGIGCIILGLAAQISGILTLRRAWSPNVTFNTDHALVRRGIYRYLRHPIYAAIILQVLGFCLALSNWTSFAVILLPNIASFLYRMKVEEAALLEVFGDEYRDYMKTTKRFVPGLI